MFLVTIWWFISAHKWFKGPKVNIEHMMLGREEAVVVGQGLAGDKKDGDSFLNEVQEDDKITKS
jgi:hypothetical protein